MILAGDGTLIYSQLVENVTHDVKRNQKILKEIETTDGATLVLSDRVEHLQNLNNMCLDKKTAILSASNTKAQKEERKNVLQKLNNGDVDVVFATYKLAKEGLDVPNLRYVIFATPQKDKTTVIQSAGRVGRKADGKQFGTVIDFVDENFGMLVGYFKKRKGYYKKLGYEVLQ
jgi:superfamily II DNA or RNA helicase